MTPVLNDKLCSFFTICSRREIKNFFIAVSSFERYFFCPFHQGGYLKKQKKVCWNVLFRMKLFVPYMLRVFFNNCFVLLFTVLRVLVFIRKVGSQKKFPPKHKQACLRNGVSLFSCVVLDKLSRKMLGAVVAISAQDYRLH